MTSMKAYEPWKETISIRPSIVSQKSTSKIPVILSNSIHSIHTRFPTDNSILSCCQHYLKQ
ncbi:hypothetical protein OIU84_004772, partial [Salix udensis]